MKAKFTSFIKLLFFHFGIFHIIRILFPANGAAILRYHSVKGGEDNFYTSYGIRISLEAFEKQVHYLTKHYNVISLNEVVRYIENKTLFKKNSIVFTFDDGYADNYDAYLILKKYGATGTFYLTSDYIGSPNPFWLFEIIYLVTNSKKEKLVIHINEKEHIFDIIDKQKAIREITILIKSNDLECRQLILNQLRQQIYVPSVTEASKKVMLTWPQVKQMHSDGIDIGGHTSTHANLPNAKPNEAKDEINRCKKTIEERIESPVRHFSYPNSGPYPYFNEYIKDLVKEAGFSSATTSINGFVDMESDIYELKRVRVTENLFEIVCFLEWDRLMAKINRLIKLIFKSFTKQSL